MNKNPYSQNSFNDILSNKNGGNTCWLDLQFSDDNDSKHFS